MDKLRQYQASEWAARAHSGERVVRRMWGIRLVWLAYLLLGTLACCEVPERASQALAEEGGVDVVAAEGAVEGQSLTDPTEGTPSPTEGAEGVTERVSDATEAPEGSTEVQQGPTADSEPSAADAPAQGREIVLTSEGPTLRAIREVITFARRKPLLSACIVSASAIALIAACYALSRYHNRPYAQRRRRRHYVA